MAKGKDDTSLSITMQRSEDDIDDVPLSQMIAWGESNGDDRNKSPPCTMHQSSREDDIDDVPLSKLIARKENQNLPSPSLVQSAKQHGGNYIACLNMMQ